MKLAVIGTGYVGLTTAACFAELGHDVIGYDIDANKIERLSRGECPIFEAGLPELLTKHLASGHLLFTTKIRDAIKDATVIFICVGTPPKRNGTPDLSYVKLSIKELGKTLDHYAVVVEKSTVPVQTAAWMRDLLKQYLTIDFDVAVNPEFLREGTSVHDFLHPDRIVVGTESERAAKIMTELYTNIKAPIVHTNLASAELIKHASNSFLAMKISYANLVSQLCEKVDADINTVMDGIGMDKRIGRAFLNAGLGYGGFCFPKDLDAFIGVFKKHGIKPELLTSVRTINDRQRELVMHKVRALLGSLSGKTIGVLGLAFKPNTDDVRLSPALMLIEDLQKNSATVRACDPQAIENAKKVNPAITYCRDAYDVAEGCDLLILATEWAEFKELDFAKIKTRVNKLVDARNLYNPARMKQLGFVYESIGRH